MNEKQLKSLFWSSLKAGHVEGNSLIPSQAEAEIRIIQEAHFRSFDLLLAAIMKEPCKDDYYSHYGNVLARTQLLESFARSQNCRIDCIRFYPVEVKSDDDTIDERLPNQIVDAILTFGLSVVVLDKDHAKRVRAGRVGRFLPATIIGYTGSDDLFEVVSTFDRFVSSGIFGFHKAGLARMLAHDEISFGRAYSRLALLQRILEKVAFNQLYDNLGLEREELEFLQRLSGMRVFSNERRIAKLVKETANAKLTDFM